MAASVQLLWDETRSFCGGMVRRLDSAALSFVNTQSECESKSAPVAKDNCTPRWVNKLTSVIIYLESKNLDMRVRDSPAPTQASRISPLVPIK